MLLCFAQVIEFGGSLKFLYICVFWLADIEILRSDSGV